VSLGGFRGTQAGFVEQVSEDPTFLVNVATGANELSLSWDAVTGALFYRVFCGLNPADLVLVADNFAGTAFSVSGLRGGMQYYVQVTAVMSPRLSIASVTGLGGGGGGTVVATQDVPFAALTCSPLASDICYQMIQANTEPLESGSTPSLGGGPQPYGFDFPINWGDDSICGWNVSVVAGFSLIATIDQNNVPLNHRKQRRVIFTMVGGNQNTFVVMSNPAVGGNALPSGIFPAGTVITIDFASDCSGNITATVAVVLPQMTWDPTTNVGYALTNGNLTASY
jgi:hypothetical protein